MGSLGFKVNIEKKIYISLYCKVRKKEKKKEKKEEVREEIVEILEVFKLEKLGWVFFVVKVMLLFVFIIGVYFVI